jgi:excisionase family DNA binding protein
MTTQEIANYLKVHRETVYAWVREGKIGVSRVGNKLFFDPEEVLASLQVQARAGGLEGNYERGYDGNEAGEAAAGNGDGVAIPVTRAGGARGSNGNPVTADLGRPL